MGQAWGGAESKLELPLSILNQDFKGF